MRTPVQLLQTRVSVYKLRSTCRKKGKTFLGHELEHSNMFTCVERSARKWQITAYLEPLCISVTTPWKKLHTSQHFYLPHQRSRLRSQLCKSLAFLHQNTAHDRKFMEYCYASRGVVTLIHSGISILKRSHPAMTATWKSTRQTHWWKIDVWVPTGQAHRWA